MRAQSWVWRGSQIHAYSDGRTKTRAYGFTSAMTTAVAPSHVSAAV